MNEGTENMKNYRKKKQQKHKKSVSDRQLQLCDTLHEISNFTLHHEETK